MKEQKKRIVFLDFLRAFAIVMVVLLHSINDYIIEPGLYGTAQWYALLFTNGFVRTGVPIFLMISGCLMLSSNGTSDIKKFYKKSLTRIIIPLLFWNVAYFFYQYSREYVEFDLMILLNNALNSGMEYHLWYLYELAGLYLVAPFLKILIDNCNMKKLVLLVFLMMLCPTIRPFINTVTPLYIYWFEPLFNGYMSCFLLGYILYKSDSEKHLFYFLLAGGLALATSMLINYLNSSHEGINLVTNSGYSLCHYIMAAAVFVTAKALIKEKLLLEKVAIILSKYSFGVYLVHVAVIDSIKTWFMIDSSPIVNSLYIFVISFSVSLIISVILGNIKYVKKLVL
ncbi:MAG: acyltransferase [Ruminococcaceae bacterium]|nr:acyltransferase [Oscillospiraceae bacterium]